ncbi:ComEC/Rec2 family competence protein [Indibacter alkaliphilus]|uniref:ComEC/Rec2 family competence protein n=1 Tax=Indibacter alkaliphilus TaxID=579922 RepID=UPI0002822B74|nr:ComEC/Rec2 family competence protein [Indibacter alkaliphilus]
MIFSEFPFLRYLAFLILGILIYPCLNFIAQEILVFGLGLSFTVYLFLVLRNQQKRSFNYKFLIPSLAAVQLALLGLLISHKNDLKNSPLHLSNLNMSFVAYTAQVLGEDEAKPNSIANRVRLKQGFVNGTWVPVDGEVLIYHRSEKGLNVGDFLMIPGFPQAIQGPTFPYEFDYRKFMRRQKITHQHFINENFQKIGSIHDQPVNLFFISLRRNVMGNLDLLIQDPRANQVAKALLLGQKKNMEKEISEAYATAGAMHILAVSGLHVGIIYGFFFLFIKPYRLKRHKRIIYLSTIILLIWGYAMLTGMSPSVMRAATMFSLMALAQMKSRSPSIFNAIALSAFILLIFDSDLIFAVGFQLSYVALTGILLFQPVLVRHWLPKNKVLEYIWQISTVGVAAQLATFPISAYYFHTFPVYFILSNLVAIPGAFLIMSFGVPLMLLGGVPFLGGVLAWLTENSIAVVNFAVFGIQDLPLARVDNIYFSTQTIFFYWMILALIFIATIIRRTWPLYSLMFLLALLLILKGVRFNNDLKQKEMIFHVGKKDFSIDLILGNALYSFDNMDAASQNFKLAPFRNSQQKKTVQDLLLLENDSIIQAVLPKNIGSLIISSGKMDLQGITSPFQSYVWEDGEWQEEVLDNQVQGEGKTYKLAFY